VLIHNSLGHSRQEFVVRDGIKVLRDVGINDLCLPLRVTPATPGVHLSVVAVFVRIGAPAFPS
jgi:hypothetical protein